MEKKTYEIRLSKVYKNSLLNELRLKMYLKMKNNSETKPKKDSI
tara:strand:+ start:421 stop:552 length:132 start_codon:yes stop_codon:yes gene_type:complete